MVGSKGDRMTDRKVYFVLLAAVLIIAVAMTLGACGSTGDTGARDECVAARHRRCQPLPASRSSSASTAASPASWPWMWSSPRRAS